MYVGLTDLSLRKNTTASGASGAGSAWSPANLFLSAEQGWWLDSSDRATMYQDTAGTTPVTALEQFVGKWLDKSGRTNHFTATSNGARPTYSARYNEWTATRDLTNGVWTKTGSNCTLAVGITPPTTRTNEPVFLLQEDTSNGLHRLSRATTVEHTAATKASVVSVKGAGAGFLKAACTSGAFSIEFYVNLSTGAVTNTTNTGLIGVFSKVIDAGNGWWHVCVGATSNTTTMTIQWGLASAAGTESYLGNGVNGVYLTSPDFRWTWESPYNLPASENLNIPGYQWVNTATDYDSNGFPTYVNFNGTSYMSAGDVAGARASVMSFMWGAITINNAARGDWFSSGNAAAAGTTNWIVGHNGAGGGTASIQVFARTPGTAVAMTGSNSGNNDGVATIGGIRFDGVNQTALFEAQAAGTAAANVLGTDSTTGFFLGGSSNAGSMQNGVIGRIYQLVARAATSDDATITLMNRYSGRKMGEIF